MTNIAKPDITAEAIFFNAVSIALDSNRDKLRKLYLQFGNWEKAWSSLNKAELQNINPEKERQRLLSAQVRLVLEAEKEYPASLREIADPPLGLYLKGAMPVEEKLRVAIVGTRKATREGQALAKRFAAELSASGATIVSGLALGIDASAHEGCLEAGGRTIAVLGNGLDHFYPRTNERLGKKIIEAGGAVVSEYPMGAATFPYRFLERNRLISGLSLAVLIVEAPETSGALATARYAAEQNREVLVIPGGPSLPNYRGSNQLIRQGAGLVTKPGEILEALGVEAKRTTGASDHKPQTAGEKTILEILSKSSRPMSPNELAEAANMDVVGITRLLTFMIIKGAAEEAGGGYTIK